jgi:hypothetical protein
VQEALLGGDGDERAGLREQDRLAHLPVPGAEGDGHALKGGEREGVAQEIAGDRLRVAAVGSRRRLADRPHRDPGCVVQGAHEALGGAAEAVLKLRRAPGLVGGMPGGRHEPLRPGGRARVGGAKKHVIAEVAGLVGDDRHVVIDAPGEHERLGLGRRVALDLGEGAELPGLVRRDRQPEFLGRPPHGLPVELVGGLRADNEKDLAPALEGEELGEPVGEHGPARGNVEQVRPAIGPAQTVVGGADVEHDRPSLHRVGDGQRLVRGQADGEEGRPALDHFSRRVDRGLALVQRGLVEGEAAAGEGAGGVVLPQRHPRAGETLVLGDGIERVGWRRRSLALDEPEADLLRRRSGRRRLRRGGAGERDQPGGHRQGCEISDHSHAPALRLATARPPRQPKNDKECLENNGLRAPASS